jgi:hypothetical protein
MGKLNDKRDAEAALLWDFVGVRHPTLDEITEGLKLSRTRVARLRRHIVEETGQDVIIPPTKPDPANGRWEYHVSYDAQHSAMWLAWMLGHIAKRSASTYELADRIADQFPEYPLLQVIAATARALEVQAKTAQGTMG